MTGAPETPTEAQRTAADPGVSAWVGANAGSGKTRVLTHRVARLLLAGAPPERILCLTYTRAAAAEMKNRLFDLLGRWTMADDDTLARELAALEGAPAPVSDGARTARARGLFARALETPGGLSIQTIHAFCDALLRRFPLEAGVSPGFGQIDDRQAADLLAVIRERMASEAERGEDDAFDRLAGRLADGSLDAVIARLRGARDAFEPGDPDPRIAARFGEAKGGGAPADAAALASLDWPELDRYAAVLERGGGKHDGVVARAIAEARALRDAAPERAVARLLDAFLTKDGAPRSRGGFPVKAVLAAAPDAGEITDRMIDWAGAVRDARNGAEIAARTRDLHIFAARMLAEYETAKAARALLDYDDLIGRAGALLSDAEMAAWVLYRLDLGIDHVLIDEAQDTSPAQWEVIDAIVSEFQSGAGARDERRTLFAVGDEKQSIYSFQGARPAEFARMRARNAERLEAVGERLARPDLITSFRSAPAVLRFVDALFAGEAASGLTSDGAPTVHVAHRKDAVGRVDLWPPVEPPGRDDDQPWDVPVDTPPPSGAKPRLARALAAEIARLVTEGRLPGPAGRRVRPGDILILVTRRDLLARSILRELKAANVPVAGSDRMRLTSELAVMDLMALMTVAATPADDLSLAALLRSPLCGITEEDLFLLAHDRGGASLWSRVTADGGAHPETAAYLRDMARVADYLRPYEFLERALIHHDGRRRLLARLGREAEDPLDELLAQALAYEAGSAPTLTGFLDWLAAGDVQIKREMEAGRDEVRLMTVHGAKGLEAPVVILPDTMARSTPAPMFLALDGGNAPPLTVWPGPKSGDDRQTSEAREKAAQRAEEERRRLLYVAATRAEDWLILCGAGKPSTDGADWYGLMRAAMDRLSPAGIDAPEGIGGTALRVEDPSGAPAECIGETPAGHESGTERPAWLSPAPVERLRRRAVPSALETDEAWVGEPGGTGEGRAAALMRGNAVHLVLERLAGRGALDEAAARRILEGEFPDLADPEDAIAEAARVLSAPFAAEIFGPDSRAEVGIALEPPSDGDPRMIGRIDRLVIRPGHVLVIDYKTDAVPPRRPEDIRHPYLAQMSSYVSGIASIFPDRSVEGAFLWTAGPVLMGVPPVLLARRS